MKRWLSAALFILVVGFGTSWAVSDTLILKVTPAGTKGVSIDATQYDFGTQTLGTQNILSTATINVENTGNISSSWGLRVIPTGTTWVAGANSATNQYHLGLIFNSAAPISTAFTNGEDDLLATEKGCSSTDFAGNQTCNNVPPAGIRQMWLSLDMPGSSGASGEQQLTVEVIAN